MIAVGKIANYIYEFNHPTQAEKIWTIVLVSLLVTASMITLKILMLNPAKRIQNELLDE